MYGRVCVWGGGDVCLSFAYKDHVNLQEGEMISFYNLVHSILQISQQDPVHRKGIL